MTPIKCQFCLCRCLPNIHIPQNYTQLLFNFCQKMNKLLLVLQRLSQVSLLITERRTVYLSLPDKFIV